MANKYKVAAHSIAKIYKDSRSQVNVDPNYVIGCFYHLYSEGHREEVDHEYTYERILQRVDTRLQEVKNQVQKFCYVRFSDSVMASGDVIEYDDSAYAHMDALSDHDFVALMHTIIDDMYRGGEFHTTDVIYALQKLDINKYIQKGG